MAVPTPDCCMTPMTGHSWLGAAVSFVGMWLLMMVPMMLPSLIPMLARYRQVVGRAGGGSLGLLTVGIGYFLVWTVAGILLYPVGTALAALEVREPVVAGAVPIAAGLVVLIAGFIQISAWKAHGIACCREVPVAGAVRAGVGGAWRHGLRLGLLCARCCGNLMAILLAVGMMDLRWMAVVTAAITVERVAPSGERLARAIGAAVIVGGVVLIARAAGLG